MTELFAVVKFTEENDAIDVVPTMWIINNDTASWYPNVTSDETKNSLVKRCAQVNTKTWTENPIKVLEKYKTYHEAMKKVHKAEVQSNLSDDTVVIQKKRSRKRKNLKLPGEDSTSETDAEDSRKGTRKHHKKSQSKLAANRFGKLVYKNFPDPPNISPKRSDALNFNNEAHINISDSSSSAHEYSGNDDDVVHPEVTQQRALQTALLKANSQADGSTSAVTLEDVLGRLSYLQTSLDSLLEATKNFTNQLSQMNAKLDSLNNNAEDQHKIKVAVINSIPAKTTDDLDLLNKAIQGSQAAKLQLETTLKAVAEQKVLNTAQNMMHKLFTDELGTKYCLKGKNPDKKQFDIDPIYHLVIECIKTVFPPTEKVVTEAREAISNWFTQSKHRIDKRKKRAEDKVKNAAQKEAERVKKAAEEEAERVKKAAAEAAEKAKKAAEEEAERAKKAAEEAAEKAKKAAEEAAEKAKT